MADGIGELKGQGIGNLSSSEALDNLVNQLSRLIGDVSSISIDLESGKVCDSTNASIGLSQNRIDTLR